jgi:hypothetical protein
MQFGYTDGLNGGPDLMPTLQVICQLTDSVSSIGGLLTRLLSERSSASSRRPDFSKVTTEQMRVQWAVHIILKTLSY